MATIHPGYKGLANIASVGNVRFTDASITARQAIEAPDLIMGDWDHDAYVYGKIEVGGSISGPVTELFAAGAGGIWNWAIRRTGCGTLTPSTVTLYYYCGDDGSSSRSFGGMLCNSLTFSCAAGEVAQFSMDLMGSSAGTWGSSSIDYRTPEKLLTWDRVSVVVSGTGVPTDLLYSNFEFTVNNNLAPAYSLSQANLFPFQIVPGIRTITGSLSCYNTPHFDGFDTWLSYTAADTATITFNIGALSTSFKVRFHRVEPASSVGNIISTVGFTGVTHQAID